MPGPNRPFQSGGDSSSVLTLGSDPNAGDLMTDTNGAGFRASEVPDDRPHLEGTAPNSGSSQSGHTGQARGLGGTVVRSHTPEELMAMANAMEQNQLEDTVRQRASAQMGQSAVSGSLDHTGAQTAGQVPSWLNDYMQHQPFTDPYHQVPMSGQEAIRTNKWLSDEEKRKYERKNLQMTKSLRK